MNFVRKYKILLLILVIILAGAGYWYSYLFVPVKFKNINEWIDEKPRSQRELLHYFDKLEEAYKNDDIGGTTPEETLALWVDAVKADDLEKASTYFLVENRTTALEGMGISKKNNVLPDIIEDIENGGIWHVNEYTGARFETSTLAEVKKSGYPGFEFTLTKNPYTGVWKIEEF